MRASRRLRSLTAGGCLCRFASSSTSRRPDRFAARVGAGRMSEESESSPVPDVLGPRLRCVFCGINPGRVSAAAHAHFANPRNDFWRLLHDAGLTPTMLEPSEQFELLDHGIGATNAAARTTPGSSDLRRAD